MPDEIADAYVMAHAYEMADANEMAHAYEMADAYEMVDAYVMAKAYDEEEILHYNLNLFVEAIDLIDAATILLSLKKN
jgi:hypothetical protein